MIVIKVELVSAIHESRNQELARMLIGNDGDIIEDGKVCNYTATTLRGRSAADFARLVMQKQTKIKGWRRHNHHVWNLVALALKQMGYNSGHPKA